MTYTLDATIDSLSGPGTIYRVKFLAVNADNA